MVELSENIIKCFSVDMSIKMEHFYAKLNSLSEKEQAIASNHINLLYQCANDLKCEGKKHKYFVHLYFESESYSLNELLQSIFDCFCAYIDYDGDQLIQELYTHTNRGGDEWFPVTIIKRPLHDYSYLDEEIIIYRGCNRNEFDNRRFCQSWTTDIATACHYAYIHYSHLDKAERVVVKAKIKNEDIFFLRDLDSEVAINLNAKLSEITLVQEKYTGSLELY